MPARTKRSAPSHSESSEESSDDSSSQTSEESDYSNYYPCTDDDTDDDYYSRDEPESTRQFSKTIRQFFTNAQRMGGSKFCIGGELDPQFGLPGLQVKSKDDEIFHIFGFPLSEGNSKELLQFCSKVGEKSWRLDNGIKIMNSDWGELIDEFIESIKEGLGIGPTMKEIDLEVDSLLVCEEGGQLNLQSSQTTGETNERIFGNVLLQLPSNFTGGEIVVKHGDNEKTYSFEKDSIFKPQFVAFYSECDYIVNKITSGYRACLSLKLVYNGNIEKKPKLNGCEQLIEELHQLITKWDEENTSYNSLFRVYAFEHVYSKTKLKHSNLKGSDYNIYHILQEYSKKYDDILFEIGILKRRVEGIDDPNVTIHLTSKSCSELDIPFWCVVLKSHLKNMKLFFKSDEERDEYGYETKKRHYRNSCLLIYPKKCQARFTLKFGYYDTCQMLPSFLESNSLQMSVNFMKELIAKKKFRVSSEEEKTFIESIIKLNSVELALHFIQYFTTGSYDALVAHFTMEPLRQAICKEIMKIQPMSCFLQALIHFNDIPLIQMTIPYYSVNKYNNNYNDCKKELIELAKKCKFTLHSTVMEKIMQEFNQPIHKDNVVKLMELLQDDTLHEIIIQRELKKIEDLISHPRDNCSILDIRLLAMEINSIGIEKHKTRITSLFNDYLTAKNCIAILREASISKEILEILIEIVMKKGSFFYDLNFVTSFVKFIQNTPFQNLTAKVCEEIIKFSSVKDYHRYIVPLTRELVQIIPKSDELDILLNWSIDLIENGIETEDFVIKPKASSVGGRVPCICGLCKKLKGFLWSDNEISYTFSGTPSDISHLESMVSSNKDVIKKKVYGSIIFTKKITSDSVLQQTIETNNEAKTKLELLLKKRRNPPTPTPQESVEEISQEPEIIPSSNTETSSIEPPSKKSKKEIEVICIDD